MCSNTAKKEIINLSVSSPITGYAGEEKPLIFTVNSKYGLDRVEWSAPQLIAANGQLIDNKKGEYRVKLPDYRTGKQAINSYVINAVAIDKQGNRSANVAVQVTVTQAAIFAGNSEVSPKEFTLAANGKAQKKITITIKDKNNQLVDVAANEISLEMTSAAPKRIRAIMNKVPSTPNDELVKISEFTRVSAGQYHVTVTSGTKPESVTLTPVVRHTLLRPINIALIADSKTAQLTQLKVITNDAIANNIAKNQVKLTIVDAQNHPVIAHPVKFTVTNKASVAPQQETDENGEIVIPITSTTAGKAVLTINYGGTTTKTAEINFNADKTTAKMADKDGFTITPEKSVANGKTAKEITITVTDAHNNLVEKAPVTLKTSNGQFANGQPIDNTLVTDDKGKVTAKLTSKVAGSAEITATVNRKSHTQKTTFTSDATSAQIKPLTVSSTSEVADGKQPINVTAMVIDNNNNPLMHQKIRWSADKTSGVTFDKETFTNDKGHITLPITSTVADEINITASTENAADQSIKITFLADPATATITTSGLKIDEANTIANGKDTKTITATVTDANGNILSDIDVKFTTTEGSFTVSKTDKTITKKTAKDGTAKVELTSTKADTVTITATVNGHVVHQSSQFVADNTYAKIAKIVGENKSAVADGKDTMRFEAQVTDNLGNPIEGATINWKSNFSSRDVQFTSPSIPTNKEGKTFIRITSYKAADVIVTGTIAGKDTSAEKVTFTADLKTAKLAAFNTLPETIAANGKDIVTLETQVVDANDNPIEGVSVHFQADNGAIITPSVISKKDGSVASVLTTNHAADNITITANIDKKSSIKSTIKSIADIKTATITLQTSSKSVPASNLGVTSGIQLTATVTDAKGHRLEGIPVIWSSDFNQFDNDTTQTDDQGKASAILYGTKAGKTAVTASLLNKKLAKEEVTFTAGTINDTNSSLKMSQDSILADGVNISMARLTLKDMWGNPVKGQTIKWSRSSTEVTIKDKGEIGSSGVYQAEVTSKKAGIHTISATINSITKKEKIGVIADTSTAIIDSIKIEGANTTHADGNSKITLVATIKDTGTNPVEHVTIGWNTTVGTLSAPTSNTDYHGKAYITVTSTEAKKGEITAQIGSSTKTSSEVEFTAGNVSSSKSTATLSSAVINAGSGETTLTVEAKDEQGNPLANLASKIKLSDSASLITLKSAFNETKPGTYEAKLSATIAKTTQLAIQIDGHKINAEPTLTIQPDSKTAQIKGEIKVSSPSAMVGENVTYSVELEDKYGNPLKAGEVVFWSANEGTYLSDNQTLTDIKGERSITVKRQTVGDAKVKLNLGSNISYSKDAPVVKFTQSNVDTRKSTIKLAQSTINADQKTVLTVTLKDKYGNLLDNLAADIKARSNPAGISIKSAVKKSIGVYELDVTSNKIATAEISVDVLGKTLVDKENITVQGDPSSWKISKVEADTPTLKAGDKKGVTYSATVVDKFNNVLPKTIVSWHVDGKAEKYEYATSTDDAGIAKVTVTSNTVGELVMTAALTKDNELKANKVTVTQGDVNLTDSTLTSNKTEIGADNRETMKLTVKVTDNFGNPIIGSKIEISSDKPHFIINPSITDNKDGSYQTTATSNKQGSFTLTAKVDGKPLTKALTVKSGAANPVLSFKNQDKSTVYSSKLYDEQMIVDGLPTSAIPIWESSNTSVASVGNDGKVKLHKAGNVKITARIQGNGVYNSAQASYTLNIDKADPQLHIPHGALNATWGDVGNKQAQAIFNNTDTKAAKPAITFSIDDTNIATIEKNSGEITQKKPNSKTAIITVQSAETDQFKAASQKVSYQLGKTRFHVEFENDIQKIAYNNTSSQRLKTKQPIPNHADIVWESGNDKAIKLTSQGLIDSLGQGESRLTMTLKSNDYFEESSGSYTAKVYTKPNVSINNIDYSNNGKIETNASKWAPVYTDDNVKVSWSSKSSSEFDKAKKVTINFKIDGSIKYSKTYDNFTSNIITEFSPDKSYVRKNLKVELIADSDTNFNIPTEDSRSVPVKAIEPVYIGKIKTNWFTRYFNNSVSGFPSESRCRSKTTGPFENPPYVVIFPSVKFEPYQSKKVLLEDISVTSFMDISKYKGDQTLGYNISYPEITKPNSSGYYEYSDDQLKKYTAYVLKENCYTNHSGHGKIDATLTFLGAQTITDFDFSWSGDP